ncbi:hypothetical protein AERO8C_60030 [Aeromonas veronii]|uniref:Uncharacterized protein n=1 Tax=Aeromonas veronii TaxID=654 RepID=A0A653L9J2_AERVE|nr:hypothetical protein AERO8C_60030 [Aeromonas veronii]
MIFHVSPHIGGTVWLAPVNRKLSSRHIVWLTSWVSGGDYTDFSNLRKGERTDYAQFYVTDGSRLRQHTLLPTPG